MNKKAVAVSVALLLLLAATPAISLAQSGSDRISVTLGQKPSITTVLPSGLEIQMDTLGLILIINYTNVSTFGPSFVPALIPYLSVFSNESWGLVTGNGSREFSYGANVTFKQASPGEAEQLSNQLVQNLSFLNGQNMIRANLPEEFHARVVANISKTAVSSHQMAIYSGSQNFTYGNLSNSTMGISFNVIFTQPIPYSGSLVLVQKLAVKTSTPLSSEDFRARIDKERLESRGLSVGTGTLSNAIAYYWWQGNYYVDGVQKNLTSTTKMEDNSLFLTYSYIFGNGTSTFYQDPYLTIPGLNLSEVSITGPASQIVHFILLHSELIVSGLIIGILLIAVPYASYRRRKSI